MNEQRRRGLAEIEALEREQEERHEQRMDDLLVKLVGLDGLSVPVAAQVHQLGARLRALLGDDYGVSGDEVEVRWLTDAGTGEVIVGIEIGGLLYAESMGQIVVRRHAGAWDEYTILGDDGKPIEPWQGYPSTPPSDIERNLN
jgi:hypothetical protein